MRNTLAVHLTEDSSNVWKYLFDNGNLVDFLIVILHIHLICYLAFVRIRVLHKLYEVAEWELCVGLRWILKVLRYDSRCLWWSHGWTELLALTHFSVILELDVHVYLGTHMCPFTETFHFDFLYRALCVKCGIF